jgi:PAS domain S-box-containing protein
MISIKKKNILYICAVLLAVSFLLVVFIALIAGNHQNFDSFSGLLGTSKVNFEYNDYKSVQMAQDIETINSKGIFGISLAIMALTLLGFVIKTLVTLYMSEDKFSKAFNSSPMMISITTLKDGKFVEVNDSLCRAVGYSREEILGRTVFEVGIWKNDEDNVLFAQKFKENKVVKDLEIRFYKKNQEQRLAVCSAELIDIGGETCLLSIFTDITEQKKMEIEMYRLDRLGLVGEMAASIGHEIRNPMTTVRGFLQIMRSNEECIQNKEYFDIMIEELDRANSIISEFLSLARNKMVELKPADLRSILTNIIPLLQANAMINNQVINLETEDIPKLLLDEKEIRQLILNLVRNGIESMEYGGILTIKTYTDNEGIVLAVEDQGNGIEPELLEKLGTPFVTTKEKGTGQGLAVCYGIAARHNAKIRIETGSNGTTFFIIFPHAVTQEASA